MALYLKLPGAIRSRQSNMAATKPGVVIAHLVDYIESKCKRLHQHIRGLGTHRNEIPFFVIHKYLQKMIILLLYKHLIVISSSCTFNVSFSEKVSESVTKPLVRFPYFLFALAATPWHCGSFYT